MLSLDSKLVKLTISFNSNSITTLTHTTMCLLSVAPSCQARTSPTQGNAEYGGVKKGNLMIENVKQKVEFIAKNLAPPLMAALITLSPIIQTPVTFAQGIDIQRGAKLFSQSCIGCHDGGGNIIQPGATLFLKDLQRNEADKEEEIYKITYYGKGRMPGFGENCTPRGQCTFGARLQDEEIRILAEFVKSQADQGWPDLGEVTD